MNYDQPEFQSEKSRLALELASWIYQSHLWKKVGVAEDNIVCGWCGLKLCSSMNITEESSICPANPKIKEMRALWVKNTLKGMRIAEEIIVASRTSSPSSETFMSGGIQHGTKIETKTKQ